MKYMTNKDKKPYSPQERQAFIDALPAEQRNTDPKQIFNKLVTRAVQPIQKKAQDKEGKS